MPQHPGGLIHARARRLRAAGEAALARHLTRRIGAHAIGLVEQAGRARAEDFTEIVFDGEAEPGELIEGVIVSHDGRRARLASWSRA